MNDERQLSAFRERLARLEERMDNHSQSVLELKEDLKRQTRQIYMGLGALAVIVFFLELLFKR